MILQKTAITASFTGTIHYLLQTILAMHGKRYRLLTADERARFLSTPRSDLQITNYAQLIEWLADPAAELSDDEEDVLEEPVPLEPLGGPALLELHLQDYIHRRWNMIFPDLTLYRGIEGREYRTTDPSVGILDFLALDRDGNFVVIETKRDIPDRQAIGQVMAYVGWVEEKLCKEGQSVRAILVCQESSDRLRLAAKAATNLSIYTYEITFTIKPS